MKDEEPLPARVVRGMGHWVPPEVPDDVLVRVTSRLDAVSGTLDVCVETFPVGYVDQITANVKVDA